MTELIIKSRIKDFAVLEGQQFSIASDFPNALSRKAEEIVKAACVRARENGRKTVMAKDI